MPTFLLEIKRSSKLYPQVKFRAEFLGVKQIQKSTNDKSTQYIRSMNILENN